MIRVVCAASFMAAAVLAGWGGAANATATSFGSYTAVITYDNSPSYDFGSMTVNLSGRLLTANGTDAFANVTSGSAHGSLTFSGTVGTTILESVTGLMTFVDPNSSTPISFDVASVATDALTSDPNNGDTLNLYILGTTSGGADNASGTPTSLIIDITGIGGNTFSADTSLSAPPVVDPIPEPATAALLGPGLATLMMVRRRRAGGRWLPE